LLYDPTAVGLQYEIDTSLDSVPIGVGTTFDLQGHRDFVKNTPTVREAKATVVTCSASSL
jgi:hypothetical protein